MSPPPSSRRDSSCPAVAGVVASFSGETAIGDVALLGDGNGSSRVRAGAGEFRGDGAATGRGAAMAGD